MSRQFEDFIDEDECCLNCGEIAYTPSKTMGICQDCFNDPTGKFDDDDIDFLSSDSDAF
jgi:hypothetical protein